jgi:hypothetical protein
LADAHHIALDLGLAPRLDVTTIAMVALTPTETSAARILDGEVVSMDVDALNLHHAEAICSRPNLVAVLCVSEHLLVEMTIIPRSS